MQEWSAARHGRHTTVRWHSFTATHARMVVCFQGTLARHQRKRMPPLRRDAAQGCCSMGILRTLARALNLFKSDVARVAFPRCTFCTATAALCLFAAAEPLSSAPTSSAADAVRFRASPVKVVEDVYTLASMSKLEVPMSLICLMRDAGDSFSSAGASIVASAAAVSALRPPIPIGRIRLMRVFFRSSFATG